MKENTKFTPAPESLVVALAAAGLDVELAVCRKDGAPLDGNDLAALRCLVGFHDLEVGRTISEDDVKEAVLAAIPPPKAAAVEAPAVEALEQKMMAG